MKFVGLLCSKDDAFGEVHSDLLVGPMLLTGITPVRFTNSDIDEQGRFIGGAYHADGRWKPCNGIEPISIIDLSLPYSPRIGTEDRLLKNIPHSKRIDLDRYELLDSVHGDETLKGHVAPCRPLEEVGDLLAALDQWNAVFIKCRQAGLASYPLLVRPDGRQWLVADPLEERRLDESQLRQLLEPLLGRYFLQAYIPSLTPAGRPYALIATTQQRKDFAWMVPTVHCIVGTHPVFASLSAAGEYIGSPFVPVPPIPIFGESGKAPPPGLSIRIQGIVIVVARRIEELIGGHPGALAFTLLLDQALNPVVVDIDTRPLAPHRAARNLEFFRHFASFSLGLEKQQAVLPARRPPAGLATAGPLPSRGISIRSQISEAEAVALARRPPAWLDIALGYGGRCLLSEVAAHVDAGGTQNKPLISLRLGAASNDSACATRSILRLNGLEEYLGRGLLRWPEARFMRSIRKPLLAAQFELASSIMGGTVADLILIDDFDLGMRPLPENERASVLQATVDWLDQICTRGYAGRWGVTLSNARAPEVTDWLEVLVQLASAHRLFSCLCVRAGTFGDAFAHMLAGSQVAVVVLAFGDDDIAWAARNHPDFPVLSAWNPTRHDQHR